MSTSISTEAVPLLFKAIEAADADTLKLALRSMCTESASCMDLAAKHLLIQKGDLMVDDESDQDEGQEDNESDTEDEGDSDDAETTEEEDDEYEEETAEAKSPTQKRRKLNHDFTGIAAEIISRYETCQVCNKRFDLMTNKPNACRVHDGSLEIDYECDDWGDDDQFDNAPDSIDPETDERRYDFPQMFIWSCCDGQGDAKPCHISRHVVKKVENKPSTNDFLISFTGRH